MSERRRVEATILIGMLLIGALGMTFVSTAIASEEATTTEAVHFNTLIEFLPDAPSGWDGEEPEGMTFTHEEGTWSMATEHYTKSGADDVTADVVITDYAFYTVGWSTAWQSFVAYETTEGYIKKVNVEGFPAWEVYDKESAEYALHVGVNDRFMVFISTNSDKDTLYDFANAIDYDGIAALGGGAAAPPAGTAEPTRAPTKAPTTSTEEGSETPGFEVVFAVVGLLAVMALLRRRR
ncbi:MAG: PGF-CTERM sorting domain-containing protein [Methanomicrobia archaeon]|nr:PGF-CTERM sorting domain-containing protein [Methanomicrobia archaeon]